MKKKKKWLLAVCFLVILLGVIALNNAILEQKYSKNVMGGFYELPKDTLDVAFIGSSHMLNGVLPMELWENYGIRAYNAGQHGQRLNMTYYYMKEVIDRQHPEVIVIDLYYANEEQANDDIANLHKSIDNLKWSKNKWDAIWNAVPKDYRWEVMYPAYLYHSRWNVLKQEDFTYLTERPYNVTSGTEMRWGTVPFERPDLASENDRLAVTQDTEQWIQAILDLGKETDTKVIFTVLPFIADTDSQAMYQYCGQMAADAGEHFLNFMYLTDAIGMDYHTDMYDSEHLNPYGARKVTEYFGKYLTEVMGLGSHKEDNTDDIAYWKEQSRLFAQAFQAGVLGTITNVEEYFQAIQKDEYIVAVSIWPDEVLPGEQVLQGLEALGFSKENIHFRSNQYLALADGRTVVTDQTSEDEVLVFTTKLDNVEWQLTSQTGRVSIMTDLQEMAVNGDSINLVVYDKILHEVIDSISISDLQEITR